MTGLLRPTQDGSAENDCLRRPTSLGFVTDFPLSQNGQLTVASKESHATWPNYGPDADPTAAALRGLEIHVFDVNATSGPPAEATATVDGKNLTGHIAGLLRQEKIHCCRNFRRLAQASHWYCPDDGTFRIASGGSRFAKEFGFDRPRGNRIDGYARFGQFQCPGSRTTDQGTFGRGIRRAVYVAKDRPAANVDDPAVASLPHACNKRLRHLDGCTNIQVENMLQRCKVDLPKRLGRGDPGVIDNAINNVLLGELLHHVGRLLEITEVTANQGPGEIAALRVAGDADDVMALFGEQATYRQTDTA
jgi:hypothetical protein